MSKRSSNLPIWNFFERSTDGSKTATCNYCHHDLSYRTSVTNLKQHLRQKHVSAYNDLLNFVATHESSAPETLSYENSLSPIPQLPVKRKRKTSAEEIIEPEFLDIDQAGSKFKDLSEFEITGISIAKKLARMDTLQAIYAESIINSVIRRGLLKKLKEETDICDNMCGTRIVSLNMTSEPHTNT